MTVLVVGASGATGRRLVKDLLNRGLNVRIVVRTTRNLAPDILSHPNLTVVEASLLNLSDAQMQELVEGCTAVASCLGHNLTFKGMFLPPRRLVRDAAMRLCQAIRKTDPKTPVKYVLMNTTGNRNRDISEPISVAQHCVLALLRLLLPPHVDNEQAADFLRLKIGQSDPSIQWCAVRPDSLIEEDEVSEYSLHRSPTRSAIFDSGKTSRINVAHFMAELITDEALWQKWAGQMPVIYNQEQV